MSSPLLLLDNVTVRYGPSAAPALSGVSLSVSPGERVALIGPSGAGKTTILGLANALVLPTSGRVSVMGVDTTELGKRRHRSTRRSISAVHQGNALVGPLRVAQNVASGRLGRWGPFEALRALIRPPEVDEILTVLARVGIPEKLWERADQLSGGQQQRVAIARSLFQHAALLLADEPVSALDPARSDSVLRVLVEEVNGDADRALVTSLHDAPLALRHCTRVIGLRDGSIAFDKPAVDVSPSELDVLYELES